MRAANLIVVILGVAGTTTAGTIAWRWRRLPVLADTPPVETRGGAAVEGLRTLAVVMASGVLAGVLVPGLGGRLVMRILGATSGDAQGMRTAANQPVGEITNSGTVGVVLFVGVLGGVVAAVAFLFTRRWLPRTAGPAGVLAGVLLLGTIGISDALSPDNEDFAILHPTWLAVTLVVTVALLFGVTFTALAARLDAGMPALGSRPSSFPGHASLVFYLVPLLFVGASIYVTGRAVARGRLTPFLMGAPAQRVGHTFVGLAVVLATVTSVRAIGEIITA